ncbi:hypothetical protein EYF80_002793 [Liparis tanakae]|uniref:Uncharacterized protein n=1 Tax=Liparis tanakae TaxID=230148 RepID=A0A4Z2JBM2_9TELE|nr:hypothetical protein EYF80_002793 [Liparis tanakae]
MERMDCVERISRSTAHGYLFSVKTATATSTSTSPTHPTPTTHSTPTPHPTPTTHPTPDSDPVKLGHVWTGRLAAEACSLGYAWTLRLRRETRLGSEPGLRTGCLRGWKCVRSEERRSPLTALRIGRRRSLGVHGTYLTHRAGEPLERGVSEGSARCLGRVRLPLSVHGPLDVEPPALRALALLSPHITASSDPCSLQREKRGGVETS